IVANLTEESVFSAACGALSGAAIGLAFVEETLVRYLFPVCFGAAGIGMLVGSVGTVLSSSDLHIVGDRWRAMWKERVDNNGLWMLDWFRHQRRDAFYTHGSVCENYEDIQVPVYAVGGWADGYTNAVFRLLEHLPGPRKGLIGPWAHKYPHFALPGPRIGFLQECLRWWDQHLKGIETGIMDEPMLRAWVHDPAPPDVFPQERPGRWVSEPAWTSPGKEGRTYHVRSGDLATSPDPAAPPITLKSPETAGHTAPTWCCYGLVPDNALDQNGEAGLMTFFETAPLEDDLDLLGFPIFEAEVASDQPQAILAATLSLIDDDGRASLISFGVLNLTHRESHAEPAPLPVGKPVSLTLQLNACGQHVHKGQRLRLALSTAYWPVIWPAQTPVTLTIAPGTGRLSLPVRADCPEDGKLSAFGPAEGATPLQSEKVSHDAYRRTRTIDYASGVETYERFNDTGAVKHLHTGMIVQDISRETFSVHPDDPNSAEGICDWVMRYERNDWKAEVDARVRVKALREHWHVTASLVARDADGVVAERTWDEAIPRDLV
ncbi:MAG: CocE/NonD family hydrolase, partial [Pseudomonadota bacterium]